MLAEEGIFPEIGKGVITEINDREAIIATRDLAVVAMAIDAKEADIGHEVKARVDMAKGKITAAIARVETTDQVSDTGMARVVSDLEEMIKVEDTGNSAMATTVPGVMIRGRSEEAMVNSAMEDIAQGEIRDITGKGTISQTTRMKREEIMRINDLEDPGLILVTNRSL